MKVQESSASLMTFLIQDLLDYAQIKAGKFRQNIQEFNVREAIEEVMSISRYNVNEDVVKFFVTYDNILEEDNIFKSDLILKSNCPKKYSPLIYSDKSRV